MLSNHTPFEDLDKYGELDLSFKGTIINIDHHLSNNKYGNYNYVDTNAAATAEIIFELLEILGISFDSKNKFKPRKTLHFSLRWSYRARIQKVYVRKDFFIKKMPTQ